MLKIVFFGTSEFGADAIKLLTKNYNILKVFTNPPKPSGRGQKLQKTPIHLLAEELNIPVVTTAKPKMEEMPQDFDIGIVVAFGSIISKNVLDSAKYGFLNIHPSDLPRFRGAAPIERTLEKGEEKTRVCIIRMTPRLDDGNIIAFQNYQIQSDENSLDLHKKFSNIGASLLPDAIIKIQNGFKGEVQNELESTYAPKILKEELELKPYIHTKLEALNKVRAFASYGFCFVFYKEKRVKILSAEISNIQKTPIDVICSDGFLTPLIVKPEGRNTVKAEIYFSGNF